MLNKIPKIHVNSLITLDTKALGLHFPTTFWAWSLPWRWYQNTQNLCLQLENSGCQGLGIETSFSNNFLSLKLALKVKMHWYRFFIEVVCWAKYPKFMFTASKLWTPGPQDCIFQHLLEPEVSPEDATLNMIQPKHLTHIEAGCVQILFS